MSEDATPPSLASATAAELVAPPPLVIWPPPGLERLKGDLWGVIDHLAVGGAVFTLPLLAALTLPQDPWRPGIYGDAWWVVLITSLVGLWFILSGYIRLFRVLMRWRAAIGRGYRSKTVGLVMADRPGDTGFLVQGGRAYSLLDERSRTALLGGRLLRVTLLTAAGVWLSAGFIVGVMLAARGVLSEGGLAYWTLLPPGVAVAVSWALRLWESGVLLNARRAWHAKPWNEDLVREEILGWHTAVAARPGAVSLPEGEAGAEGSGLTWAAAATLAAGVAMLVFAIPLVTTAGVGPALAEITVPAFSSAAERAARGQALSSLRLPVDPAITAVQAGEALRTMMADQDSESDVLRAAARSHGPIFADDSDNQNPTGLPARLWPVELVPRLASGLDAATRAYLVELGRHPALAELSTVARAGAMDEIAAVYVLPLPDNMSAWELPIPRYGAIRELAYAQVGAAVGAAAAGRTAEAETRLRELVSAGLLMGTDGATLLSNLIGYVIAGTGADALVGLYDATGRADDAQALRELMSGAARAARLGRSGLGRAEISGMPDMVADTTTIRGIRVEYLTTLSTIGPCLNLNRAVFGPPDDYEAWLERMRTTFARTEGERQLFEMASRGWATPESSGGLQPAARIFGQVLGGGVGSCAELAAVAVR